MSTDQDEVRPDTNLELVEAATHTSERPTKRAVIVSYLGEALFPSAQEMLELALIETGFIARPRDEFNEPIHVVLRKLAETELARRTICEVTPALN